MSERSTQAVGAVRCDGLDRRPDHDMQTAAATLGEQQSGSLTPDQSRRARPALQDRRAIGGTAHGKDTAEELVERRAPFATLSFGAGGVPSDESPLSPRESRPRAADKPGDDVATEAVPSPRLPNRALSIRQPWAWMIIHGGKDIENRSWATRFRGSVLIHAAKGMTVDEYSWARHFCRDILDRFGRPPTAPRGVTGKTIERGGIVGVAEIVGCVTESDSPWFVGDYGFVLANVRPLPFFQCKGALGFFACDYPEALLQSGGGGGFETVATPRATTATDGSPIVWPMALGAVPPIESSSATGSADESRKP